MLCMSSETTANILSATRLPMIIHRTRGLAENASHPALGFASQPCDWFAFSRMMTLQALVRELPFA